MNRANGCYVVKHKIRLAALLAVMARFSDGPIGPIAGGALRSGELVKDGPADWSFAADISEIEFQLLEPARSRITWILIHEGQPYIPCGTPGFRLWKQWPHEAMVDGRALLRIDNRRYERQAVRVTEEGLCATLTALLKQKYPMAEAYPADPDVLWFFRMEPRAER